MNQNAKFTLEQNNLIYLKMAPTDAFIKHPQNYKKNSSK